MCHKWYVLKYLSHQLLTRSHPFSQLCHPMEDVWKELTLASLDHRYSAASAVASRPPVGWTLQEFLTSPSDSQPISKPEATVVPRPQKKLLNNDYNPPIETPSSSNLTSTDAAFCACSKRKAGPSGNGSATDDRKKYRLMKNRESAARSRARKQAYTDELELELAHLMEENSKLRKQQEQLCSASLGDNHQKKQKLHRTLTAPF